LRYAKKFAPQNPQYLASRIAAPSGQVQGKISIRMPHTKDPRCSQGKTVRRLRDGGSEYDPQNEEEVQRQDNACQIVIDEENPDPMVDSTQATPAMKTCWPRQLLTPRADRLYVDWPYRKAAIRKAPQTRSSHEALVEQPSSWKAVSQTLRLR
jgi:hypothetical protein